MRKLSFKISKGLKTALVVSSLMGVALFAMKHTAAAKAVGKSFAFVGVVAGLKQRKVWESLDEGTKAFAEELDKQTEATEKELKELQANKEAVEKAMKEAAEKADTSEKDLKELQETAKKLAQQLDEFKNRAVTNEVKSAIAEALVENKEKIQKFLKEGGKKGKLEIEVKASQTAADIAEHTLGDRVPGIGQLPVRRSVIESLFPVVNTTSEHIYYIDQETAVRDAKNVAGCATSTHNTKLTWKQYDIRITKVRDFLDVCQDMMEDYSFVEGELRNLLNTSVNLKVESGLLLGDGVYPNLNSIDLAASTFDHSNTLGGTIDAFTATVKDSNIFDLTVAMCAQVIALGQDNAFMPNAVLWNSIDKYKSMLIKDANGQYLLPPFVVRVNNNEYTIDDMKVVTSPLVPANTCYVMDSTKGTLYVRKGIVVELSYENNDNFETETVTLKAYRRMNLLIRNVNKNAFMKCTDITAALAALTKAV